MRNTTDLHGIKMAAAAILIIFFMAAATVAIGQETKPPKTPFVPTLDHPFPPQDPNEYLTPIYQTSANLAPHVDPVHIVPFKSGKTAGLKIAVLKRPLEVAGKSATEAAAAVNHLEFGFCGKSSDSQNQVIKPCVSKEIR